MKERHLLTAFAFALLVGLLGVAPHAYFAWRHHEACFFVSGDDEPKYYWDAIEGQALTYRALPNLLCRLLNRVCGGPRTALIAADFVFPFVCTLAVALIAWPLFSRRGARLLCCVCLLFGWELLSVSCYSVWPGKRHSLNLMSLRAVLPSSWIPIVPDTSYAMYQVYRTPDPQVSDIFLFLCLAVLVRTFATSASPPSRKGLLLLLLLHACLPFIYVFLSIPLLLAEGLYCLVLWRMRRVPERNCLAGAILVAGIVALGAWAVRAPAPQWAASAVFSSRLPVVTPSVATSVLILLLVACLRPWRRMEAGLFWLGAILVATPVLVLNQQLVTGRMVSGGTWERNVCYPVLVTGMALLLPGLLPSRPWLRREVSTVILWILLLYAGGRVTLGQVGNYFLWSAPNEKVAAYRSALAGVDPAERRRLPVLVEDLSLATHLYLSEEVPLHFLCDCNEVYTTGVPLLPSEGVARGSVSVWRESVFESFARNGARPADVALALRDENDKGTGMHLFFLYNLMDYWPPVSDWRHWRKEAVDAAIDADVRAYQEYLAQPHDSWRQPCLLLTSVPPNKLGKTVHWTQTLVCEGTAGGTKVYLYRQEPQ